MSAQPWEPGDPLYHRNNSYRDGLFNFRDDATDDECHCADAAGWPEPIGGRHIAAGDELGRFIREWHEWNDREPST